MDDRTRKEAGRIAEQQALDHLRAAGLRLLGRNFRCRRGEIDLVMMDGATLVCVEVRYRAGEGFGGAAASVTWRKQLRIARATRYLLMRHAELRRHPVRFDVVALSAGGRIDWIRHAFMDPGTD